MGDVVTTMSVIVVANAVLLPAAAYACVRLGLLPGVDWYWPFQRHRDRQEPRKGAAPPRSLERGPSLR